MTFARIWTIVRWPLALVGLFAIVNYAYPRFLDTLPDLIEFDASGSILDTSTEEPTETFSEVVVPLPNPTLQPPTGPVVDGFAGPIADFHVNDTVADIDAQDLILTDDAADSVIIAFALPPGDPGCMASVSVTLTVSEVLSPTEIGIFASDVSDAAEVLDNQQVDGDLRLDPTPMTTALLEAPGSLTLDITAGYQRYFTYELPPATPFVLAVVPTIPVETQGGVRFVAADQLNESAPTLTWVGTPGCPVDATPAPTPTAAQ